MTVVMHHQPVLNFHTGLVAKVAEASRRGGVFLVHDLDTLKEPGSCTLRVPKQRGKGDTAIRLFEPNHPKKKLFTVGTVKVANSDRLEQALLTMADGKIRGNFRARVAEFAEAFPTGTRLMSVADLNVSILKFVLPRLGLEFPRTIKLSDWLWNTNWQEAMRRFLDYYPEYEDALRECGVENKGLPFWGRNARIHERFQVSSIEEARAMIGTGRLIPKGRELVWMIRVELETPMIRGLGGASYEQPLETVARELGKRIAPATTVTSRQGVPAKWREAVRDQNFRPSALLLWLLGGKFDHRSVIRR